MVSEGRSQEKRTIKLPQLRIQNQYPLNLSQPFSFLLPSGILLLLSTCYGLISLVAIFGNLLVIVVVTCTRSMHNVTNFYIANLASADVIIALFCIPFQVRQCLTRDV